MTHWFDTGAFAVPRQVAVGNSGHILEVSRLQMKNIPPLGNTFSFRERLRFTFICCRTECLQPCKLLHSQLENHSGSDDSSGVI